jgi:hypothetical protein
MNVDHLTTETGILDAQVCSNQKPPLSVVPEQSRSMHPTSHFKTRLNDLRATMKLRALVANLHLQVSFLDRDIHDEEQRTGVFDVANVSYPILARALSLRARRRDNVLATIPLGERRAALRR